MISPANLRTAATTAARRFAGVDGRIRTADAWTKRQFTSNPAVQLVVYVAFIVAAWWAATTEPSALSGLVLLIVSGAFAPLALDAAIRTCAQLGRAWTRFWPWPWPGRSRRARVLGDLAAEAAPSTATARADRADRAEQRTAERTTYIAVVPDHIDR